jgi:hypothetical protein
MSRPCPCRWTQDGPCDACERRAEARQDGDDLSEPDRGQRAEEQADREERVDDERFGAYSWR